MHSRFFDVEQLRDLAPQELFEIVQHVDHPFFGADLQQTTPHARQLLALFDEAIVRIVRLRRGVDDRFERGDHAALAAAAADLAIGGAQRDRKEPGGDAGLAAKFRERAVGREKRLLREIFDVGARRTGAEHAIDDAKGRGGVLAKEVGELRRIGAQIDHFVEAHDPGLDAPRHHILLVPARARDHQKSAMEAPAAR